MNFILLVGVIVISSSPSHAGLLKIPKVYNALITSDQNLTPSRAFPVLQPVIHRTALGYVPPFYYPQIAPQYVPEVVDLGQVNTGRAEKTKEGDKDGSKESDESSKKHGVEQKNQHKSDAPLKFYPNYQTVLYEPYFYTYSGLGPQVEQVSYRDYQTQQMLDPLPPEANDKYPERLLPHLHEESPQKVADGEKIPDVPPPPLPMTSPKGKSS